MHEAKDVDFDEIDREIAAAEREFKCVEHDMPVETILRSLASRVNRLKALAELKAPKIALLSEKRLVEKSLRQFEEYLVYGKCIEVSMVARTTEELSEYDAERGMAQPIGRA